MLNGSLSPANPDGAGGWYRTAPAVAWKVTERESGYVGSGCQRGADPADTPGRTIRCTVTSGGGAVAEELSYKKDGPRPRWPGR